MPVSDARMEAMKQCTSDNKVMRGRVKLDDRSLTNKLTDEQILGLNKYMRKYRIDLVDILTYEGLNELSKVLCRWPRPSEVSRLFRLTNGGLTLKRVSIEMDLPRQSDRAKFVGKMGENLNVLTKKYNLMYAWLHTSGSSTHLHLYGIRSNPHEAAESSYVVEHCVPGAPVQRSYRVSGKTWIEGFDSFDSK